MNRETDMEKAGWLAISDGLQDYQGRVRGKEKERVSESADNNCFDLNCDLQKWGKKDVVLLQNFNCLCLFEIYNQLCK